ncbi:MAG: hypothetical protein Cons2KO_17930 [Congregibacter sp.]
MKVIDATRNRSQTHGAAMWAGIRGTLLSMLVPAGLLAASHPALALTDKTALAPADVAFYTFGLTAVMFSLAIIVAYRAYKWVSYIPFAFCVLATVSSMDGTLLVLLGGGEFTQWVLPFLIYTLTAGYGYWLVASGIEAPHRFTALRPALLGLAATSVLLAASSALWLKRIPLNIMWIPANVLFVGMLLSQSIPPLTWTDLGPKLALLTRLFPFVVGAYYAVVLFVEFALGGWGQQTLNSLNRAGLLLVATFAVSVVVARAFASAKKQEDAERAAMQLAKREAELQASLLEAERSYQQAQRVARAHQSQLAAVSHDLKQPISALRIAIDGLPAELADRDRFHQAVDYIGSLAHTFLEHENAQEQVVGADSGEDAHVVREGVSTAVFATGLKQMFESDAVKKHIDLQVFEGRRTVCVHPLKAMRVMSNLLGNAFAHSGASRVVVGFRSSAERVIFAVHDNGAGMDTESLETAVKKGHKREASDGHGLGLAIVKELCDEQGFEFCLRSTPGHGTSAYVSLPAMAEH